MTAPDDVDRDAVDPGGMLAAVEASPEQWREAVEAAVSIPAPEVDAGRLRAVVVAGMGGSGITADVAVALADRAGAVPVVPAKGYELPAWVGPDTLVVGVSYSGTTEETLACLTTAGERGAPRYAITTGGDLAAMAGSEGFPCAEVPSSASGGSAQPRANLPNLTARLLAALDAAGVLPGVCRDLAGLPGHLDRLVDGWRHDVPADRNPAEELAASLQPHVPVFYGAGGLPAVVALRAKCQVNENAERPAFHHALPELDHNEIVGWSGSARDPAFALVVVRSPEDEHPRLGLRAELTAEIAGPATAMTAVVPLEGPTAIARFAAGVLFVDLLSVHLALLDGTDPTPVAAISELKSRLAERST